MEIFRNMKIHVEVPYFFFGLSLMFDTSITPNFLLYRTCYVSLGYDRHECSLLGTEVANNDTKQLENKVQAYATHILMVRMLLEAFIPPLLCLFLAPWSDKYGRRPLMLLGILNLLMSYVTLTIVSSLPHVSPWYFLLNEISLCLGGSNVTLMAACLSYVSDVTPEENRGIRLGLLDAAINTGMLIGTLSSSYVFKAFGYPTVYLICAFCQFFAWMFTFFYIEESVEERETEGKWKALLDIGPIKETIRILFKRRPDNDRAIVLCLFCLLALFISGRFSDSSVIYLYLLKKFDWTLQRYTMFFAISLITWTAFCVCLVIVIGKLLHLNEPIMIIIATIFSISGALCQGFATQNWQIYGATILKCVASYLPPMTQSLLSRLAPKEEIGKMFSALMTLQSVSLLLSNSFNTYVYSLTLESFPQAFNFVTAGLHGLTLIVAISLSILYNKRNSTQYNLLINENEEDS